MRKLGHTILGYIPPTSKGENITVSVYRKPTHMDRYLDFNSSHPISAKKAVVRASWIELKMCVPIQTSSQGNRTFG